MHTARLLALLRMACSNKRLQHSICLNIIHSVSTAAVLKMICRHVLQVRGWRTLDSWTEIPVTADQTPEAPGLPGADGRQKLPVSPSTTMKFTLNYKAYNTSE